MELKSALTITCMDLGADLCCDSAHKTLPVLTGGAYLHIGPSAPADFGENARQAMSLFGSTSPSYLILQSLDLANAVLAVDYPRRLSQCAERIRRLKTELRISGWQIEESDPLKLTVAAARSGHAGLGQFAMDILVVRELVAGLTSNGWIKPLSQIYIG